MEIDVANDPVKMRSLGWAPIQHDRCPYKKRRNWTQKRGQTHTQRPACGEEGRDKCEVATSQGTPKITSNTESQERSVEVVLPPNPQKELTVEAP